MDNLTLSKATREYREKLLKDPFRPGYHFTFPDSNGIPGDPNGFFYARGKYHLMYLYEHSDGAFHWGHASSKDLMHWRHHQDALGPLALDGGCFSGGAFVDDDETAWLSYWIFSNRKGCSEQGIGLAKARPPYEDWERLPQAVIPSTEWGILNTPDGSALACADPSNIWKDNGLYYMQTGNKPVLDKHGRHADSPQDMRGDWTELFKSRDLIHWEHCGRFYQRKTDNTWTQESEDDMCPSFLPLPDQPENGKLTDTMLQLFISHNMGCQYYTGKMQKERFYPTHYGRMTWIDDTFFAPEAVVDDRNRQIMFTWLRDDLPEQFGKRGWCGAYSLPRQLWLRSDGELGMKPISELQQLRVQEYPLDDQGQWAIPTPCSCELQLSFAPGEAQVQVLCREDGASVKIGYDARKQCLFIDTTNSGTPQRACREEAPLSLQTDEALHLQVFVDHSIVEVFANERQAITRRVYNDAPVLPVIRVTGRLTEGHCWEMMPSMPY